MIRRRAYGEHARRCRMQFMASRFERDAIEREAQKRGCSISELLGVVVTATLKEAAHDAR